MKPDTTPHRTPSHLTGPHSTSERPGTSRRLRLRLAAATWGIGASLAASTALIAPAPVHAATVAAPVYDPADSRTSATAILAGGCFWGVEGVFERVRGVQSVSSGYAGGTAATAKYGRVSDGDTNHAEAVLIRYDPRVVSYGTLLRIYFAVAHDPTELNRQGPDTGRQYRSAIFPITASQLKVAKSYITQLDRARSFNAPIVTTIESGRFYTAEAYHQDYMKKHPDESYIIYNDAPKVAKLGRLFPKLVK